MLTLAGAFGDPEAARDLVAVHVGHPDVEQDEIRSVVVDEASGLGAARCRSDHFDVRLTVQHEAQALPRDRLVIDDQDS